METTPIKNRECHFVAVHVFGQWSKCQGYSSTRHPVSRASLKIHQRASKKGSAEIVSSLLSCRSPSFCASHSGQTGLGSAHIIFLTKRRPKSSLQYENQYGI